MTATDKPKRKKWTAWRILRWTLGIWLIVVIVGLTGDRHLTFDRNQRLLAEAIAETDRLDPRWRWEEMDADRAPLRDEDNSAVILRQIYDYLPDGKNPNGKELDAKRADGTSLLEDVPANQLPGEEDRRLLAQVLADHQEPLHLALKLADYPRGYHPLQLADNPLDTRIGHSMALRKVYWLLSLEAESRLLAGNHREGLRCVRAILRTGASIRDEGLMISQLLRIAVRTDAVKLTRRILALAEPVEGLSELQAHFDRELNEDLMSVAVRGERAVMHRFFEKLGSRDLTIYRAFDKGGGVAETGSGLHNWRYQPLVAYNHALALQFCNRALEVGKRPWHERQAAMDSLPVPPPERETILVRHVLASATSNSVFARLQESVLRDQAALRCAIVGIACERYRIKHKAWPKSLESIPRDLLPELPDDPYDGKPLRYVRTADGVVVYSVGPDLADNGGDLERRTTTTIEKDAGGQPRLRVEAAGDVGFRLWNPNRRGLELLPVPKSGD